MTFVLQEALGDFHQKTFGPVTYAEHCATKKSEKEEFLKLPFDERLDVVLEQQGKKISEFSAQRKGAKPSALWKYYRVVEPPEKDHSKTVVCLQCYRESGTVNLLKFTEFAAISAHTKRKHPDVHIEQKVSKHRIASYLLRFHKVKHFGLVESVTIMIFVDLAMLISLIPLLISAVTSNNCNSHHQSVGPYLFTISALFSCASAFKA